MDENNVVTKVGKATYYPFIPPKVPKAALSYLRSVLEAPGSALAGVVVDGRHPDVHPVTPRCRVRLHVGTTNRWRLPESLHSDLLGTAQAIKALRNGHRQGTQQGATLPARQLTSPNKLQVCKPEEAAKSRNSSELLSPVLMSSQCSSEENRNVTFMKKSSPSTRGKRTHPAAKSFKYPSKQKLTKAGPDVILHCAGTHWELHRLFLGASDALSALLVDALDNRRTTGEPQCDTQGQPPETISVASIDPCLVTSSSLPLNLARHNADENLTHLELDIHDPDMDKQAMAVALGNLYCPRLRVPLEHCEAVLGAAHALKYHKLTLGCVEVMMTNITRDTVCSYHNAATKYGENKLMKQCEQWLLLNLIPQLTYNIRLADISPDLMFKLLKSERLFLLDEFSVYKVLAMWSFLLLNPDVQIMPTYKEVLAYFNSQEKTSALLDRDEAKVLAPLFVNLRLHGFTDTNHLEDVQVMNILPQSWIIKTLAQHYHSLNNGGDMTFVTDFSTGAIRYGFVLDQLPCYHSEMVSLHGFHFELKAARQSTGAFVFCVQRLRPTDPLLSFRQSSRNTYSLQTARTVQYSVTAQWFSRGEFRSYNTGVRTKTFGLSCKDASRDLVTLEEASTPLFVRFDLLMPTSS